MDVYYTFQSECTEWGSEALNYGYRNDVWGNLNYLIELSLAWVTQKHFVQLEISTALPFHFQDQWLIIFKHWAIGLIYLWSGVF